MLSQQLLLQSREASYALYWASNWDQDIELSETLSKERKDSREGKNKKQINIHIYINCNYAIIRIT